MVAQLQEFVVRDKDEGPPATTEKNREHEAGEQHGRSLVGLGVEMSEAGENEREQRRQRGRLDLLIDRWGCRPVRGLGGFRGHRRNAWHR